MKADRSILMRNDQNMGDIGDPDKLENSIEHLANVIDANDNTTISLVSDNTKNKSDITSLKSRATVLETDNTSNKNRIGTNENRISSVQNQVNQLVVDGDSSVEAAQARVREDGKIVKTFPTLQARLNDSDVQLVKAAVDIGDLTALATEKKGSLVDAINDGIDILTIGKKGKKYKVVACVIRNEGAGWKFIDDTGHVPLNALSVTNDSTLIEVKYDFIAKKVLSFVAAPDETMAMEGYTVGASVGLDSAKIHLNNVLGIGGYVEYDGTKFIIPSGTSIGVKSAEWTANVLRVYHDPVTGAVGTVSCRNGAIQAYLSTSTSGYTDIVFRDYAGTQITVPNTNMKVYLTRTPRQQAYNPNIYTNPTGNIWCYGIFEV